MTHQLDVTRDETVATGGVAVEPPPQLDLVGRLTPNVIPAEAGIHVSATGPRAGIDPGLRRDDIGGGGLASPNNSLVCVERAAGAT